MEPNKILQKAIGLLLIAIMFLSGCQATPDKQAVANKNQDYLKDINTNNINNNMEAIPKSWEESFELDKGDVNIKAEIKLPQNNSFPLTVVKPHELTNDDIDRFRNTIYPGVTFYTSDEGVTKEELEQEIIGQKEMIARLEEEGKAPQDLINMHKDGLREMEAQYQTAKSKSETIETETKGHFGEKTDQGTFGGGYAREKNGEKYGFDAYKSSSLKLSYIRMNDFSKYDLVGFEKETEENAKNSTISFTDAKEKANKIANGLGLNDFILDASGQINIFNQSLPRGIPPEQQDRGYFFIYVRNTNGILVEYQSNAIKQTQLETPTYFEIWPPEYLRIDMDMDGNLMGVSWESPSEVVETIAENVQLLPFSDIQERFKSQAKAMGSWKEDERIKNKDITIHDIKLNMCRIAMKNNPNQYIIVPVWDFYSSEDISFEEPGYKTEYTQKDFRQTFMTINAIDGSIIDRVSGY